MDDNFAPNFQEMFAVIVNGKDIAEARFNAYTALEKAIGILSQHHWKLAQMQHALEFGENAEGETITRIVCNAMWVYDPNSEGGKPVEEFEPNNDSPTSDLPEPEKSLVE
jgi:hypothetical protein